MWKFVTRGIRESIERRICRTNVYSQSSQDGSNNNPEQNNIVVSERKFGISCLSAFYHGYCGNAGHLGTKDKGNHNKYDAKYTWTDAVGWSSVLAVGYVVCQSLCIRRKLFEVDNANIEKWRSRLLVDSKQRATQILGHLLLPKPYSILPIGNQSIDVQTNDEILIDKAASIKLQYGPVTAEEAFQQAVNQFSQTHNSVMGDLELNYGSQAVEEQRYDDAFEHFATGAKLSSTGSMFNLGLCYELGLGTSVDYGMAVKYYKKAADNGHTDAMYNLGVYHAQGKGGLELNKDAAARLFREAAKKGHLPAQKALQLERSVKKHLDLNQNSKYHLEAKTISNAVESSLIAKLMNYDFLKSNRSNEYSESKHFDNQYLYDENVHSKSPTDIFLEMLNVHERSAIPLISVGETGP